MTAAETRAGRKRFLYNTAASEALAKQRRPDLAVGRRRKCKNLATAYFAQNVARPWQVTMPPSGEHLYCLLTTL